MEKLHDNLGPDTTGWGRVSFLPLLSALEMVYSMTTGLLSPTSIETEKRESMMEAPLLSGSRYHIGGGKQGCSFKYSNFSLKMVCSMTVSIPWGRHNIEVSDVSRKQ